jgi:hypothetical protein
MEDRADSSPHFETAGCVGIEDASVYYKDSRCHASFGKQEHVSGYLFWKVTTDLSFPLAGVKRFAA